MHYFEIKQVLAVNCSNCMLKMKEYISGGDKIADILGNDFLLIFSPPNHIFLCSS